MKKKHKAFDTWNATLVWISQKSQENSQKRANTDTRIRRVQKEAKDPKPKPEKSSLRLKDWRAGLEDLEASAWQYK
ncbi:hypothetical protein Tco_0977674 [Tanacetum coccineum]|uniref:Uncharacterized protein n=1 Tax=Tanacetum coccineum TaxID=301880 RepID=A0ABQ5EL63_9ASTR